MRPTGKKTLEHRLKMPGVGENLTSGVIRARLSFLKKGLEKEAFSPKVAGQVRSYMSAYSFRLKHGAFSGNLWRKRQEKLASKKRRAKSTK